MFDTTKFRRVRVVFFRPPVRSTHAHGALYDSDLFPARFRPSSYDANLRRYDRAANSSDAQPRDRHDRVPLSIIRSQVGDDLRSTALTVNPWSDHADARPHITARTRWARAREEWACACSNSGCHAACNSGKGAYAELALTAATSRPVRGTRRAATVDRVGFLVGALVAVAVQWAIAGSRMGACTASAIAAPCMRRRGESKRGGGADEHAP